MTEAAKAVLTPAEVVTRWGKAIQKGTLANWRSQKKGPPYSKRGAKVVYPLPQLEKWEAENMHLVPANDNQPDDKQ